MSLVRLPIQQKKMPYKASFLYLEGVNIFTLIFPFPLLHKSKSAKQFVFP